MIVSVVTALAVAVFPELLGCLPVTKKIIGLAERSHPVPPSRLVGFLQESVFSEMFCGLE